MKKRMLRNEKLKMHTIFFQKTYMYSWIRREDTIRHGDIQLKVEFIQKYAGLR